MRPVEYREQERKTIERFKFADLRELHPNLKPPSVEGPMRSAEPCNVISYSKVGHIWMVYGLALSFIAGPHSLGIFPPTKGKLVHVYH